MQSIYKYRHSSRTENKFFFPNTQPKRIKTNIDQKFRKNRMRHCQLLLLLLLLLFLMFERENLNPWIFICHWRCQRYPKWLWIVFACTAAMVRWRNKCWGRISVVSIFCQWLLAILNHIIVNRIATTFSFIALLPIANY